MQRFSRFGEGSNLMGRCSLLGTVGLLVTTLVHGAVPFERVQTILNTACMRCHAGETAQGGVRLDTPEGIARVAVPGKSYDSLILQRVTATDVRQRMPPGGPPLNAEEIALLRSWIDAGAVSGSVKHAGHTEPRVSVSEVHWAYRKPIKPALPEVRA